jgi:putative lipoprotein
MRKTLSLACLAIVVYSCQSSKNVTSPSENEKPSVSVETAPMPNTINTPEQLVGKKWLLTHLNGELLTVDHPEQQPFALFDLTKQTISGFSGCNSYSGICQLSDNQIKVSLVMSTRRFCEGSPEADFFRLLDMAKQFEISDNQLIIKDNHKILMTFRAE